MMIVGNSQQSSGTGGATNLELIPAHSASSAIARQLVDVEILYMLNFGAKSGYELRKQLSRAFGIRISYGTLYPHLHALERLELISGTWSQREESAPVKKRVYALTQQGTALLRQSVQNLSIIANTMQLMMNKVSLLLPKTSEKTEEWDSVLSSIQSVFSKRGYMVSRDVQSKGISGTVHELEFLASRTGSSHPTSSSTSDSERVVVRLSGSSQPLSSLDQVMKAIVVAKDIGAKVVILAVPPLSDEVAKLSKFHGITVFEGAEWKSVLAEFASGIDSCLC
ncbi:MAG TPA: PadR family transcriptional regulator [Nitrososphaerales archaeon]|nr:PadR family transcriptional regulator [Nitrososphaerales archaeon]